MEQSLGNPSFSLTGLSEEQVKSLKGIFAVIVLMHHLYQSTGIIDNRYLGGIFQALGFLLLVFSFSYLDMDYKCHIVLKNKLI